MEVFGLLAHAVLTSVGETTFDTSLAWTFVAYNTAQLISLKRKEHVMYRREKTEADTYHTSNELSDKQNMPSWPSSFSDGSDL